MGSKSRNKTGKKKIIFCNNYVRLLAKPNKRLLMQTFLKHYPHFDIIRVENIVVMLDDKITPKEARKIIKEDKRMNIVLKRKKDSDGIEQVVGNLLNIFELFVCNNEPFYLNPFEEQLSEAVYLQLLKILGIVLKIRLEYIKNHY